MTMKKVIPALDIRDGRVVSGVQFQGLRDAGDPVTLARRYDRDGADELYILDITATVEGRAEITDAVRTIVDVVSVPVVIAGGIATVERMEALLGSGVAKVCVGSAAVRDPELIRRGSDAVGSSSIVVSIDCARRRRENGDVWWEVVVAGGREATGMDVLEWAERCQSLGAGELLVNSIETDGVMDGYDNELNRAVSSRVDVPIIASGGAGELQHLVDGIVNGGADGVLAASIFHFGHITIAEAKAYLTARGVSVARS